MYKRGEVMQSRYSDHDDRQASVARHLNFRSWAGPACSAPCLHAVARLNGCTTSDPSLVSSILGAPKVCWMASCIACFFYSGTIQMLEEACAAKFASVDQLQVYPPSAASTKNPESRPMLLRKKPNSMTLHENIRCNAPKKVLWPLEGLVENHGTLGGHRDSTLCI